MQKRFSGTGYLICWYQIIEVIIVRSQRHKNVWSFWIHLQSLNAHPPCMDKACPMEQGHHLSKSLYQTQNVSTQRNFKVSVFCVSGSARRPVPKVTEGYRPAHNPHHRYGSSGYQISYNHKSSRRCQFHLAGGPVMLHEIYSPTTHFHYLTHVNFWSFQKADNFFWSGIPTPVPFIFTAMIKDFSKKY